MLSGGTSILELENGNLPSGKRFQFAMEAMVHRNS